MSADHQPENTRPTRHLLVTGGAGFIGTNFVHYWCEKYPHDRVVVLDLLTYAGRRENLAQWEGQANFRFVQGNICDRALVDELLRTEQIDTIVHLAAESHVDRSIVQPDDFIQTNVVGTLTLLEAFRQHRDRAEIEQLPPEKWLFLQVSTDEVFGSLEPQEPAFKESNPYKPNSPYAASKAGSDHLVRAFHQTYTLPTITTHCSNNYGPYHHPEKLIPLICTQILQGKPLPIYGDGQNIRDWLHVSDHCRALDLLIHQGKRGQVYNIGSNNEVRNLDLVYLICNLMDELAPHLPTKPSKSLITFVRDRPGHDRRYAINANKIAIQYGWRPRIDVEAGLRQTVQWYLDHRDWWQPLVQ
jgi:dTDP-glucose 4,6-dehydratase